MGKRTIQGGLTAVAVALLAIAGHAVAPRHDSPDAVRKDSSDVIDEATTVRTSDVIHARREESAPETAKSLRNITPPSKPDCAAEGKRGIRHWLSRQPVATTPDESITQAMMEALLEDGGADNAIYSRLAARWPRDVGVAWQAWEHCLKFQGCNRKARVSRLLELDGSNAYAWMAAMDAAIISHDAVALDRALARAAAAPIYDNREGTRFLHAYPAFAAIPVPDACWPEFKREIQARTNREPKQEEWAEVAAQGFEMARAAPLFALGSICDTDGSPMTDSRRRDCISLLGKVASSDDLEIAPWAMRKLIPLVGDLDASAPFRERLRQMLWLQHILILIDMPPGTAKRMWSEGRIPTYIALAREQGLWPAPAGWLPGFPRLRRIITEGR